MPLGFPTLAFHNPPALRKSPLPCCPPPTPVTPTWKDRPLSRCSLLCPRALLYFPHLNQDIPIPPVSSSHLCPPSLFQRPSPVPAAGCAPCSHSLSPSLQAPAHYAMHSGSCVQSVRLHLETDHRPSEIGKQRPRPRFPLAVPVVAKLHV